MRKLTVFLFLALCLFSVAKAVSGAPEITAAPGQADPYKTRSELLMEATRYTGVFTPEQAAAVWARGMQTRSAAMQYTVMTEKLKREYAGQLDDRRSNWVTGMSSPSVVGYAFTTVNKPSETRAEIALRIEVAATHSPSSFYDAKLWLVREGAFWRIERIWADEGLFYYTLYQP